VGWRYLRETVRGRLPRVVGHNPLGAWMVVLMLLLLLVQAASGLFADDEIATQGPLAVKVPDAWVSRMSTLHYYNQYVVLAAVLLHVVAIAVYWKVLRVNLVKPMVDGSVEAELAPGEAPPRMRSSALALALLAASAAAVYALVVLYPGAP
jgi:cytochrome b